VLEEVARPDAAGMTLLKDAADAMKLSARGYHRVLRVARTSPISTARRKSAACIWRRRCPIVRWRMKYEGRLEATDAGEDRRPPV
jgi:hypothetical protein